MNLCFRLLKYLKENNNKNYPKINKLYKGF